jgi:AcrR family transcriptional regulator
VSGGRRRLDPEERRREILAAARLAFASHPYAEVRIEAIARDAGASRALVSHYFGDKRGLFLAVARDVVTRTPAVVRTDLGLGVEEMVAANTDAWLDLLERSRETAMIFLGAGPFGRDPQFEALQDELRDALAERILVNHLGTTDLPPAARLTMRAATGMMEQAIHDWLAGKGATRAQAHAIVAQTILATVRHVLPAVLAAEERPQ